MDYAEQATTGMADRLLVNSHYTQGQHVLPAKPTLHCNVVSSMRHHICMQSPEARPGTHNGNESVQ